VTLRQIFQRLFHAPDNLDGVMQDLFGEAHDPRNIVGGHVALYQLVIALREVAREVGRSVAVRLGVDGFDLVQDGAYFARIEPGVGQEVAEIVKRALEIDVVFPQRIVGVDDQILPLAHLHTPTDPLACPLVGATARACWICRWRAL